MTDIKSIAAACANRIFDRMELCRGSAMLKSDIEREVEMALCEYAAPEGSTLVDTAYEDKLGLTCSIRITPKQAEERGIPRRMSNRVYPRIGDDGYVKVQIDDAAETAVISKHATAYDETIRVASDKCVDPPERKS